MTQGDGVGGSFSDKYEIILTMTQQPRPGGSFKEKAEVVVEVGLDA